MGQSKAITRFNGFAKSGFALAEVLIALFVVALLGLLIGSIGEQVVNFSTKSRQVAAVIELRARTTNILKNTDRWLDRIRVMPTGTSEALLGSCLVAETSPATSFTCPDRVITPTDPEIIEFANSGQYKVMDTPLVDASGVRIAGDLSEENDLYMTNDGVVCQGVNAATECPLQSVGFFLRENPLANANPGKVKFAVKITNNPAYLGKRISPFKAHFTKIDLSDDWSQTLATTNNTLCVLPSIQVGIKSDGAPLCMNPSPPCNPGQVSAGINTDGTPLCSTVPNCIGTKAVLNTTTNSFECASTSPCTASDQVFLGYYTGSGQAICSTPTTSCAAGEVQMGANIVGSTLVPQCKSVPTCTATEEIAYNGSTFSCVTSNNPGGNCPEGEVVLGISTVGKPVCGRSPAGSSSSSSVSPPGTTLTIPNCSATQTLTSNGSGGLRCVETLPNCGVGQTIVKEASGYRCADLRNFNCDATSKGLIRLNDSNQHQRCDGTSWVKTNIIQDSCKIIRGPVMENDSVLWCSENFPTLYACRAMDDSAPSEVQNLNNHCPTNGRCDAREGTRLRGDLGTATFHFETVEKAGNVQGCWQYDQGHSHADYKLEIMCCE